MRSLTINEINGMDNGEIIPSFTAKVTKLWPEKRGEGQYGPWLLQNMDVSDDTGDTKVTWGGDEPLFNLEGRTVTFESSDTKHGLQGIKREIRTAGGKTYEGVKLTGVCKINIANGSAPPTSSAPRQSRAMDIRDKGQHGGAGDSYVPAEPDVDGARRHIMQAANLLLLCKRAADSVLGDSCDPEDGRTLFIDATRAGFIHAMPDNKMVETRQTAEPFTKKHERDGDLTDDWSQAGGSENKEVPF